MSCWFTSLLLSALQAVQRGKVEAARERRVVVKIFLACRMFFYFSFFTAFTRKLSGKTQKVAGIVVNCVQARLSSKLRKANRRSRRRTPCLPFFLAPNFFLASNVCVAFFMMEQRCTAFFALR